MRKVSKDSRYNRTQDLFAASYGELSNESQPWNGTQINALLDAFLVDELRYISSKGNCLRRVTGRSSQAVSNMLWKLGVNYDRPSVREYSLLDTCFRKLRVDKPFTMRDRMFIELATGREGQANGASTPRYVGKILARSAEEVEQFFAGCAHKAETKAKRSPFRGKVKKESLATIVYSEVFGSYKRVFEEIGL